MIDFAKYAEEHPAPPEPVHALDTHDFDGDTCLRCGFDATDAMGFARVDADFPTCDEWRTPSGYTRSTRTRDSKAQASSEAQVSAHEALIAKLRGAKPVEDRDPFIGEGKHKLALAEYFLFNSTKHGQAIGARFVVLESTNPKHTRGQVVFQGWYINRAAFFVGDQGEIDRAADFAAKLQGVTLAESGDEIRKLLDAQAVQPARGMVIECTGIAGTSKKDPTKSFTDRQWATIPQTPQDVAGMRQWLDSVAPIRQQHVAPAPAAAPQQPQYAQPPAQYPPAAPPQGYPPPGYPPQQYTPPPAPGGYPPAAPPQGYPPPGYGQQAAPAAPPPGYYPPPTQPAPGFAPQQGYPPPGATLPPSIR